VGVDIGEEGIKGVSSSGSPSVTVECRFRWAGSLSATMFGSSVVLFGVAR